MSEGSHLDREKQRKLDFMRLYAETVLASVARKRGIKMEIERDIMAEIQLGTGIHKVIPHKVWMDRNDTYLTLQMAYWSDGIPQDPPAASGVSFGNGAGFGKTPSDSPAQSMAKSLEEAFHDFGFSTNGNSHENGFPRGYDINFPRGHPTIAGVFLNGSLDELVRKAKSTELGRYLASEPTLGQS